MAQQEFCKDCHQKHDCKEAYRQLDDAECPSFVSKVIIAFLLPIVVFIVSIAVFEKVLSLHFSQNGNYTSSHSLQTFISFVLASLVTFIYIFIMKIFTGKKIKE